MIKTLKWVYSLGYNAALKDVLSVVADIPNEKPAKGGFKSESEAQFNHRFNNAMIRFVERQALKNHIRQTFDPNYKPDELKELL